MTEIPIADRAAAARTWWRSLQPAEETGRRGDRATLARLRRAGGLIQAAAEPATVDLFRKLRFERPERDLARAALIAAVLAHVRRDDNSETVARSIGTPRGGDGTTALLTPLRLKRLIAAREPDDLLIGFRRAVAILGDTANVKDLARQLLAWTDPDDKKADRARTLFAFDYHGAGQYAPQSAAE
jgi:CRISPR system Cascade subunit CasB